MTAENYPKLMKDIQTQQKAYTPSKKGQGYLKSKDKKKNLKNSQRKKQITNKEVINYN